MTPHNCGPCWLTPVFRGVCSICLARKALGPHPRKMKRRLSRCCTEASFLSWGRAPSAGHRPPGRRDGEGGRRGRGWRPGRGAAQPPRSPGAERTRGRLPCLRKAQRERRNRNRARVVSGVSQRSLPPLPPRTRAARSLSRPVAPATLKSGWVGSGVTDAGAARVRGRKPRSLSGPAPNPAATPPPSRAAPEPRGGGTHPGPCRPGATARRQRPLVAAAGRAGAGAGAQTPELRVPARGSEWAPGESFPPPLRAHSPLLPTFVCTRMLACAHVWVCVGPQSSPLGCALAPKSSFKGP